MNQFFGRHSVGMDSLFGPTPVCFVGLAPRKALLLAVETIIVASGTIATVALCAARPAASHQWFVIPCILVSAALIPAWIANREFARLGLDRTHLGPALGTVCRVFLYVFPLVFLGLWMVKSLGLPIPLQPVFAGRQNGLAWLLYQFLYVAVAEEVFFRGYVQANTTRLLARVKRLSWGAQQRLAILISAACFALAHVAVQGRIAAALTFLPGLLLAWLFMRTRSLLAPILFHGLANITYGAMAMTLA